MDPEESLENAPHLCCKKPKVGFSETSIRGSSLETFPKKQIHSFGSEIFQTCG